MRERSFAGLRLAVRLARREMRRRPWRTALVVLMVLVPTASMTVAATFVRTSEWGPGDRMAAEAGQADATASVLAAGDPAAPPASPPPGPPVPADGMGDAAAVPPPPAPAVPGDEGEVTPAAVAALRGGLPAGSAVLIERRAPDRWRDGDRRVYLTLSDLDLRHPLVEGRFGAVRGRAPEAEGEAVVSEDVAAGVGLSIGDAFRPERLGRALTVVGTVRPRAWPEDLVITPGPLPGPRRGTTVWVDLPGRPHLDADVVAGLPSVDGWELSPVLPVASASNDLQVFWTYVGGAVALAVLGTVIAAAFAVAARRQLRALGLLSATGASPRTLRWFLIAQGATTGVAGSALGVAAGLALAAAAPDRLLRSIAGRHVEALVVRPADIAPIVVIGTVAAAVAAWLPARSTAAVPTLQALAGRRPLAAVPARLPALGALAVGAGCALFAMAVAGTRQAGGSTPWALVAIAGGLACLFGALAACPWVVAALERLAGGWPQSWRLAARSLGRSRVRSSAVVAAIVAVSAALVAGTTLFATLGTGQSEPVPWIAANQVRMESFGIGGRGERGPLPSPVPAEVVDRLRALLPAAHEVVVEEIGADRPGGGFDAAIASFAAAGDPAPFPAGGSGQLALATPALLELFAVPGELRQALDRGAAVAVTGGDGHPASVSVHAGDDGAARPRVLPLAPPFRSAQASLSLPQVLVAERTALAMGLTWQRAPAVTLVTPEPLTAGQRRSVQRLAEDLSWEHDVVRGGGDRHISVQSPGGPDPFSPARARALALALAFALVAAVVAIGLSLAARDSEDERRVLTAVGAAPRTLRRVAALRAAMLVAAAAVVAVPAGLLPAAAIVEAATAPGADRALRVDGPALLFVVVGAPLLVGSAVSAAAVVRDRLRPPRPDAFGFGE